MNLVAPRRRFGTAIASIALAASSILWPAGATRAAEIVPAARAALPESIRAAGVLRVATSLQWPPFGYATDTGQPDGIDIRLIRVLADKLGLRAEFENVRFPTIVPGVANGRFDIGANSLSRTAEREQVVNFVVYFRSQLGLLVRRGTTGLDVHSLCGRTLALTQGSSQVAVAQMLSERCVRSGQREISMMFFPNSADMRKMHLAMRANALAVFPGGFGTLDELFELLTLTQTRKAPPLPIVLFGAEYWRRVVCWEALAEYGMVDAADCALFEIVDSAEAGWEAMLRRGLQGHSPPEVARARNGG